MTGSSSAADRRELRLWLALGGSVLFNAVFTVVLVMSTRAPVHYQHLAAEGGAASTVGSATGTHSRRSLLAEKRQLLQSVTGCMVMEGSALKLTCPVLIATNLTVGTNFATNIEAGGNVLTVFGNGFFGTNMVGGGINQRTVIYPGKASMSWPGPKGELTKAWVGRAWDDAFTKEQLSVAGMTTLGTTYRSNPNVAPASVLKVYGSGWFGKDQAWNSTTIEQRTVIYPGKSSMSWPGPKGELLKAWVGRAFDDAHAKDKLSVAGTSSLGTNSKGAADTVGPVMKVYGEALYGNDIPANPNVLIHLTRVSPGRVLSTYPATPAGGGAPILGRTYLGRRQSDNATVDQLFVFGNASLANGKWTFRT